MMLAFVLIAGSLAAGAAVLLLLPLMRQREDARPAAGIAASGVLLALLLGGAGLYAVFSNYSWVETPPVAETPAAMALMVAPPGIWICTGAANKAGVALPVPIWP